MKDDIEEMKNKIERLEQIICKSCLLKYPLSHLLDCGINLELHLRPLIPTSATEAVYIEQMEIKLKAIIHEEIKNMERKINDYLRLRLL